MTIHLTNLERDIIAQRVRHEERELTESIMSTGEHTAEEISDSCRVIKLLIAVRVIPNGRLLNAADKSVLADCINGSKWVSNMRDNYHTPERIEQHITAGKALANRLTEEIGIQCTFPE